MDKSSSSQLRKKRERLLRSLDKCPGILRGSLIETYKKCGKPGCKCALAKGHGPKCYLSVSFPGTKPQMDYVPQQSRKKVAEYISGREPRCQGPLPHHRTCGPAYGGSSRLDRGLMRGPPRAMRAQGR